MTPPKFRLNQQLRKIHGPKDALDLRMLGFGVFEEASRALAQQASGNGHDALHAWPLEDAHVSTSGSPDLRIAC